MSDNSFTPADLSAWLSLAVHAAEEAGKFLSERLVLGVTSAQGHDIKLDADRRSEEHILEILTKKSDFAILTEESGRVRDGGANGLHWIIDPLDGSMNYLKGIPLCCVSIALWQENNPLLGVVNDFNRQELFTGIVGVGAWLNGLEINVNMTSDAHQAVLCTGFPVSTDLSDVALVRFVNQVREYKKVRLFGSAALSLAYVAAGRTDAYYERDIMIWDVAAGLALVRAAGGLIIFGSSRIPEAVSIYAGSPGLPVPVVEDPV